MNTCSRLEVIPQVGGNCWFNAILMALLYSEETRRITNYLIGEWSNKDIKEDKLKKFFKYINKYNYSNPDKIKSLFTRRVKTEFLLLSYLSKLKEEKIYKTIKNNIKKDITHLGYYNHYIIDILNYLNYKYIDFYYTNETIYGNIYNKYLRIDETNEPAEIIVLFHYDLYPFSFTQEYLEGLKYKLTKDTYDEFITGIENYEEIITIGGINYKLDSCLMTNYNKTDIDGHAILGLSCFDESYVYNGWNIKGEAKETNNYTKKVKTSCKLMKHDWKSALYSKSDTNDFCINKNECDLAEVDENDLCFNFGKGNRILIYVKEEDFNPIMPSLEQLMSKSHSLKSKSLSFKSKSLSPLMEEFYELEDKTIEELKQILIKDLRYLSDTINSLTARTVRTKLKLLYIDFFDKLPEDDESSGSILKRFLIYLIKKYIKDDIRYNLSQLYNSKTDMDLFIYLLPLYQETITKYYLLLNDNNRELIYKDIPEGELNDKLKEYYPNGYDRKTILIYNIIELLKSK